jgi:transposase
MHTSSLYIGIDVAKAQLDIAVRPSGEQWTATNDEAGISTLVARLHALRPTLVVLEATGGREVPLVARARPKDLTRPAAEIVSVVMLCLPYLMR